MQKYLTVTVGIVLGLALGVSVSAQAQEQKQLREACVASERVAVARDANDFSHLKDTDWQSSAFCTGVIAGFEAGANHTVYVLSEPKRLEIFTSQHRRRQIAKAIVAFIDEHPDENDVRNIMLGALQKAEAAMLFGNIKIVDLTPDCPKDAKDMPPGGCKLNPLAK